MATKRKVRYAVVGLGHISQVALLPAFAHARKNSELAALVSGDATKRRKLGRRYGVPAYDYEEYDDLLESGEVDAVYIGLPNHLHAEYSVRALQRGVHVLCEKPMAVTEAECLRMLEESEASGAKLMIAYRLHFEKANLNAVEHVHSGKLGEPRLFQSTFTMQVRAGNIRTDREKGGGPVYDIGIYCINAARYLFRDDPIAVTSLAVAGSDARFREVEEAVSAVLLFPGDKLASFTCSFGSSDVSAYELLGTKGGIRVDPAFEYQGKLAYQLKVGKRTTKREFAKRDQFAPELLHFSECIQRDVSPEPSGLEGLIDVRIIEAIHASAAQGTAIALPPLQRKRRPGIELEKRRKPVRKPELVKVKSAST